MRYLVRLGMYSVDPRVAFETLAVVDILHHHLSKSNG